MKKLLEKKLCHNQITFCHTNSNSFEERKIHSYHEILYFIKGEVSLFTESFIQNLECGSIVLIPKDKYHLFQHKNDFVRLKISFDNANDVAKLFGRISEIKVISNLSRHMYDLLQSIISKLSSDTMDEVDKTYIYAAFLMLLCEAINISNVSPEPIRENNHLITKCIKYIDDNISKKLTLDNISKNLGVSSSTLSHIFKQNIGVSLHKYICEKRLTLAKRLIDEQKNPTKVFFECGYSDYSSFYKAYVKMFGTAPSDNKN